MRRQATDSTFSLLASTKTSLVSGGNWCRRRCIGN